MPVNCVQPEMNLFFTIGGFIVAGTSFILLGPAPFLGLFE